MDWNHVDYCDVFISCLDSHSDGTHSLQRIYWWASDVAKFLQYVPHIYSFNKYYKYMHISWVINLQHTQCEVFTDTPMKWLRYLSWWRRKCSVSFALWLAGQKEMGYFVQGVQCPTCMPWTPHGTGPSLKWRHKACGPHHEWLYLHHNR